MERRGGGEGRESRLKTRPTFITGIDKLITRRGRAVPHARPLSLASVKNSYGTVLKHELKLERAGYPDTKPCLQAARSCKLQNESKPVDMPATPAIS